MVARTSTAAMNNTISKQLMAAQLKYNNAQNEILTTRKINKPSDDPSAASRIAITKKQLNDYNMYSRSINSANLQINSMENALAQTNSQMERAAELVTQAASETTSASSAQAIKSELQELMKSILMLANSQVDGQYIFSGANTETPAYTIDNDGNVTYQGSADTADGTTRQLEIYDGTYVPLNQAGDSIFGSFKIELNEDGDEVITASGIFGVIGKAIHAMETATYSTDDIRAQIDEIKTQVTNISAVRAQFGSYSQRIEMTQNTVDENKIVAEDRRSQLQDVDLVEAISNLTYQDYILQASMKVGTNMLSHSLLDYI